MDTIRSFHEIFKMQCRQFSSRCCFAVLFVVLIIPCAAPAQKIETSVTFQPVIGNQKLVQNLKYYFKENNDSISVDVFRFYISQVEFMYKGAVVSRIDNGYYLVDMFDSVSCQITCPMNSSIKYDHVRFNLGIDSATNVSGVMGGALDPANGMYWAWQSGYINMKLEGYSRNCKERNNRYQFHLGGYFFPFNALKKVELPVSEMGAIRVAVDIREFFVNHNMAELSHVMSPCEKAVSLSGKAAGMFKI